MRATCLLLGLLLAAGPAAADTSDRLLQLMGASGVSGYETDVRDLVEMQLPLWARVRADNLGNIVLRIGNGGPHTLVVAPLDEGGLVVSAITEDGYLRVHRHTSAPGFALATQYLVGQPIRIRTSSGTMVNGVTATPSTHLSRFSPAGEVRRVKDLDDVWIDVGARDRDEVAALGIRMLDSITLRHRATRLAGGRVAGPAASQRAAAQALIDLALGYNERPGVQGQVSLAWVTQTQYGNRGLQRLVETLKPDRVVLLRGAVRPAEDTLGTVGAVGGGPILADDDAAGRQAASGAGVTVQTLAADRVRVTVPGRDVPVQVIAMPALFAGTPVETADVADVGATARLVGAMVGLPPPTDAQATDAQATDAQMNADAQMKTDAQMGAGGGVASSVPSVPSVASVALLEELIETYGVSGHEGPVRDVVLKHMPAWATPVVDDKGNVTVTFGSGGKPLLFVAHMDEVGYEITGIEADGRATVTPRGGMYLSLYEAQPMVVVTPAGLVPAVMAPRPGYASAAAAQPAAGDLRLDFGTTTAAATAALGVAAGQSASIRKDFMPLAGPRAAGRAMDDRNGSTALLLALATVDPAAVGNRVTFAWVVEEETGLAGAAFLAGQGLRPDTAFAVDTFVSTDTPVDVHRVAGAPLGGGAVLRGLDSRTVVRPDVIDRIVALASREGIPLQVGVTSGGTDASAFSETGAIDVGLSWPGRYSHSPVEIMDARDLDALVRLIVSLASQY
ncbi:MAG: M20/M25/M40 family metallo-hydrolase [Vicinamibacterales bacterium]